MHKAPVVQSEGVFLTMREFVKLLINNICILMVSVVVGFILIYAAYLLPIRPIRHHIAESVPLLGEIGAHRSWTGAIDYGALDISSEGLMVEMAGYEGDEKPLLQALMNFCWYHEIPTFDELHPDTSVAHLEYGRYWNGYVVVLKPLFMFLNLAEIRMLNITAQLCLLVAVCLALYRKLGIRYTYAFLGAIAIYSPISAAMGFHFSSVYYIMTFTTLAVLCLKGVTDNLRRTSVIFLLSGILLAYTDLLSAPLLTVAIPLQVYELLDSDSAFKKRITDCIVLGCCWLMGYGGMWASKWFVRWMFTGSGMADATGQVALRLANGNVSDDGSVLSTTPIDAIRENVGIIAQPPVYLLVMLVVAVIIVAIVRNRNTITVKSVTLISILISITPFIWFATLSNHSTIHAYFTYRILGATVFSGMCAVIATYDVGKTRKD